MNQSTLRQLGYEFFAYKVRENGRPRFIDLRYKGRIIGTFRDVDGAFVCSESEYTPHLYTHQLKGVRLDKSHDVFHFVAKQVAGHTSHQEECGNCGCADEEECVTTDDCIDVQSVLEDVDEVHTALTDLAVKTERIADVLDCVDWEQANWNAERSRMIGALDETCPTRFGP